MNRYKGRAGTAKHGFMPLILDYADDPSIAYVLDNAHVEYGTGCWVGNIGMIPDEAVYSMSRVWEIFHDEEMPENCYVYNTCNLYRTCYNPNCLEVQVWGDDTEFLEGFNEANLPGGENLED